MRKFIVVLFIITAFGAFVPGDEWKTDGQSAGIYFSIQGPTGKVHGSLAGLTSTLLFDSTDLRHSSLTAVIPVATIRTGNKLRDKHLREKPEWFQAAAFPQISFATDSISRSGHLYLANGKLTIKGITRVCEIPFHFSGKDNEGRFSGSFSIDRTQFGMTKWKGVVGKTVQIDLDIPVTR